MSDPSAAPMRIRPMTVADIPDVLELTAAAFRIGSDDPPAVKMRGARMRLVLDSDPDGAFVAVDERERIIGHSQAIARGRIWVLSLLAVLPGIQSRGGGRALLDAALAYRSDLQDRIIVASNDSRALRLYGRAGFALVPAFEAHGVVRRERLPPPDPEITVAGAGEVPALAGISTALRGGDHTRELRAIIAAGAQVVRLGDRGFAVTFPGHGIWMLAALDERSAERLLWAVLAASEPGAETSMRFITGAQQWAIRAVLEAGLTLTASGGVCTRGNPGPLHPYVPSGPFA